MNSYVHDLSRVVGGAVCALGMFVVAIVIGATVTIGFWMLLVRLIMLFWRSLDRLL
jgi:hypothetical protein